MQHPSRKEVGFSLIELMIAVVIVGVIATVALPAYQQQILKTKRKMGNGELLEVLARQEQFFVNNKQYAGTLDLLGYPANPYAIDSNGNSLAATAADRIFTIQLSSVTLSSFKVSALPQLAQTKDTSCGTLQISSTGVKTASSGNHSICWK